MLNAVVAGLLAVVMFCAVCATLWFCWYLLSPFLLQALDDRRKARHGWAQQMRRWGT